jgi:hypothetical protein
MQSIENHPHPGRFHSVSIMATYAIEISKVQTMVQALAMHQAVEEQLQKPFFASRNFILKEKNGYFQS